MSMLVPPKCVLSSSSSSSVTLGYGAEKLVGCSAASASADQTPLEDDKNVVVPFTGELLALDRPLDAVQHALEQLSGTSSDWFAQYEALVTLRRAIVHHPHELLVDQLQVTLQATLVASESLRSAISKNALLTLAESFEFLSMQQNDSHRVLLTHPQVVTALLKRSASEKKFLRDAAMQALEKLAQFGACLNLVEVACAHAESKNSRICANAASLVCASLERLQQRGQLGSEPSHLQPTIKALGVFRRAKEVSARNAATKSFKIIGQTLGFDSMRHLLLESPSVQMDKREAARILEEIFGVDAALNTESKNGRSNSSSTLRNRMHQQRQ